MSRTTIKDIARECGVSLSTVSLVLNNNPRISSSTREKVLEAVQRHNYQPNAFAQSLASRSSQALSVVVPNLNHVFSDVYFGEIVSGIYEKASAMNYKVLMDIANQRFVSNAEYIRLVKSRRVDGILFIGSSIHDDYLRAFEEQRYPMLLVNHYFPGRELDFIAADYRSSGQLAAQHLLELGHRRIGFITATNTHTAEDFRRAFYAACSAMGVDEERVPWADGWFTEQGGYEATQWLLTRHPELTAFMAGNDKMAVGAIRYLRERKLRIPEDVSVMGMDDIPTSEFTNPRLTTVRHELFQIGELAVEKLLSLFRKESETCRTTLPVRVVVRESTGPAQPRA